MDSIQDGSINRNYVAGFLAVICLAGCAAPGAAVVESGAVLAPVDANAVVDVMLASPRFDSAITAKLAEQIQFSPDLQAALKVFMAKNRATSQASGPQTAGEGGVNIGTVLLDGSTGIILALLAGTGLAGFLLWKLRKNHTLIDLLVKHNEINGADTEAIRLSALSHKVEPLLRNRLTKVREKRKKTT